MGLARAPGDRPASPLHPTLTMRNSLLGALGPSKEPKWRSESAAHGITAPGSARKKTSQSDDRSGGTMAKNILHMITPLAHMSPFDVNMALDAGYDATASYTNVSLDEVTGLVQDAMFSRSPRDATRTGVFIGGKDALLALDMVDAAGKA